MSANKVQPEKQKTPELKESQKVEVRVDVNVENLTAIASDIISLNEQIGRNVILLANVHNQMLSAPAFNAAQKKRVGKKNLVMNVEVLNQRKGVAREGVTALIKTVKNEIEKIEEIVSEI